MRPSSSHLAAAAVLLAVAAGLAGCNSGSGTTATTPSAVTTQVIDEVETASVAACGFLPTASAIAALATSSSASATAADQLATKIAGMVCAGVSAAGANKGAALAENKTGLASFRVDGVTVTGRYVVK